MDLEFLPLLKVQRDLLDTGRGFARFNQYLAAMTNEARDDITLPLWIFNPMAKPHVAELLDALIATGAEGIVAAAIEEARARLRAVPGRLRVGLVVADDAQGGWTDRHLSDAQLRFGSMGGGARGFATAIAWTGEAARPEGVRAETLAAIYRAAYLLRHGEPQTLRAMLAQEGLVGLFAGATLPLDPDDLARARATLAPHLDTTAFPVAFACLYGDEAARAAGYPPLGMPARGGFAVALADARVGRREPVGALLGAGIGAEGGAA